MNNKALKYFFLIRVETSFIVFIDLENRLKVPNITISGFIVHVLLQYKVGATPELGLNFCEVYAAGGVLPSIWSAHISVFGSGTPPQTSLHDCISADSVSATFLSVRPLAPCFIAAMRLLQFDSYLPEHRPRPDS